MKAKELKNKKQIFSKIGQSFSDSKPKQTKKEILASNRFLDYLDFLDQSKKFILDLKPSISEATQNATFDSYQRAKKLDLLRYVK